MPARHVGRQCRGLLEFSVYSSVTPRFVTLSEPTPYSRRLWAAFFAGVALMSGLRMALAQSQGVSATRLDLLGLVLGATLAVLIVALPSRGSRS